MSPKEFVYCRHFAKVLHSRALEIVWDFYVGFFFFFPHPSPKI